jgi:hypothetical protein
MSLFLDRKYINTVSSRLARFTNKGNDVWNFRCPFCGDSKTNKRKARGYIFLDKRNNSFFYKCWNCNLSLSLNKFFMDLDPSIQKRYKFDKFQEKGDPFANTASDFQKQATENVKRLEQKKIDLSECSHISDLDPTHVARKYVERRKIPKNNWKYLLYTSDFKAVATKFDPIRAQNMIENDARLVILFYYKNELVGCSGRTLDDGPKKTKYITIKVDDDAPKLFGLDKIEGLAGNVLVFEGPIDSMFFDNAIATADANLTSAARYVEMQRLTLVFDNQPRNKDVVRNMRGAVDRGYKICIWPDEETDKDINDMILHGKNDAEIYNTIQMNTFDGMKAKLRMGKWAKV